MGVLIQQHADSYAVCFKNYKALVDKLKLNQYKPFSMINSPYIVLNFAYSFLVWFLTASQKYQTSMNIFLQVQWIGVDPILNFCKHGEVIFTYFLLL